MSIDNPLPPRPEPTPTSPFRASGDLLLISVLILFLELACIRWFPAHVLFLSFFTNTVLLACFVGMSVGCLVARKPTSHVRGTPYWLLAAVGCLAVAVPSVRAFRLDPLEALRGA